MQGVLLIKRKVDNNWNGIDFNANKLKTGAYIVKLQDANESIGSQPITSYGTTRTQDLLLFSTDCDGNFRWSKTFGGGMTVYGGGLETDVWAVFT